MDEIPNITTKDEIQILDDNILQSALMGKLAHCIYAKLVPSSFYNDITIDENLGFDDAQLVVKVAMKAKYAILGQKPIYYYRQRSSSVMHSNNKTLYQAYKTYLFYLDIAKAQNPPSIPFLEEMIALQSVKLSAVNYNEEFSKKKYKECIKTLKKLYKKYGLICSNRDNKQIKLAVKLPFAFKIVFNRKRKKDIQL